MKTETPGITKKQKHKGAHIERLLFLFIRIVFLMINGRLIAVQPQIIFWE